MMEHSRERCLPGAMRRLPTAALLLAALAVWPGCTKDADEPITPVSPAGETLSEGTANPREPEKSKAAAAESPPPDQSVPSSAPSDRPANPEKSQPIQEAENAGEPAPKNAHAQPAEEVADQPTVPSSVPQLAPPAQVRKPEVVLSRVHEESCLAKVGDQFPPLTLPGLEGSPRELSQLYGDRMTIVVFWTAQGFYAREQFARIMHECRDRYAPLGVAVVAISVGDPPDVVQQLAAKHGVKIPCLLDEDGAAFGKVATGLLPRTYLLDAEGRILWFDLEYSRSQRLELHNAVYYHAKQNGV